MTELIHTRVSGVRECVDELCLVTILWQLHISFPQTVSPASVSHFWRYMILGFSNKLVDAMLGDAQGKGWAAMGPSSFSQNRESEMG